VKATNMKIIFSTAAVLALLVVKALSQGTILWNESVNGALSNDYTQPTSLGMLQVGTNSVFGKTEFIPSGGGGVAFEDYVTFSVPSENRIGNLWLASDKPVAAWFGTPDFGSEYGYIINPSNGNLLSLWGFSSISAGTYGMYIKNYDFNSGLSVANYRLDFVIEAIPEPSSLWLLVGGLGFMGIERWKRRV